MIPGYFLLLSMRQTTDVRFLSLVRYLCLEWKRAKLHIHTRAKIQIFLFESKPKPLFTDVVKYPVFSVYTNSYVLIVRIIKAMEETLLPNILKNKVTGYKSKLTASRFRYFVNRFHQLANEKQFFCR